MKKLNNSGLATIFIVLLTLVAVGVGFAGYRVYQNSKDKPKSAETKTSAQKNQEISEDVLTQKHDTALPGGWKVYTNKEYGFSFNLPEEWKVAENNGFNGASATNQLSSVSFGPPDSVHDFMVVEVLDMKLDEMLTNEWFNSSNIFKPDSTERKNIVFNGYKGYRYNTYNQPDNFYYFYEVNGKLVLFQDNFGGDYHEADSQKIYESFSIL